MPALPIQNKLAANPKTAPQYAVEVKSSAGETLKLGDPKATRALIALMDMQAVMGGAASHFGGPSAFAELMSAALGLTFHLAAKKNKQWFEMFHIVNDAGHCENGLYALKSNLGHADLTLESLKGFRSIQSKLTGHGESHLFPEGVYLSNGPLGSALPQSQGLCFADRLSGNDRVTITAISDGASMEGEAKESFAAIPGLAKKGKMNPFVMIISDNNTKLGGRIDQDSFPMAPTFESLAALGWKVLKLEKAHDLKECLHTLEQALKLVTPEQPVAIHAKTIKGYGVKKTADSASGGHGFPLKDPKELTAFLQEIYGDEQIPLEFTKWAEEQVKTAEKKAASPKSPAPEIPNEKIQVGVAKALIKKREEGLPVLSITSDLPGSTGVADFQKKFPEATQDVGVAESNMISMAAGLSKEGYIPVVDTFAQFGVTKGALPLTMASLSEAPVIAIFSHTGFQDAADGASHQALSYLAQVASIPHTEAYALSCSSEAEALVSQAVDEFARSRKSGKTPRNMIFFLGREDFPRRIGAEGMKYELRKSQVVYDSSAKHKNSVTVVAAGSLLNQAMKAVADIEAADVGVVVVNPSSLNHPDLATITTALKKTGGRLVTVEDHQVICGFGSILVHQLALQGVSMQVKSLGVKDEFGQSAYKANELYAKHGIDAKAIATAAKELAK